MRLAAVQHLKVTGEAGGFEAVADLVAAAVAKGVQAIFLPAVEPGVEAGMRRALDTIVADGDASYVLPVAGAPVRFLPWVTDGSEDPGPIAVLVGDDCFKPESWNAALEASVKAAVLCPLSENDMQAEAALEVAIALSDSLCGLVIVAEHSGAELGDPGHGGSAVVLLGDVAAEAFGDTVVLVADVLVPVPQPEPPEPLPQVPTILAQRLAHHGGTRLGVGYLADLSEGRGGS